MQRNNVLVSVVIVTYNSSSTIIETIDSVYAQTYDNIELIISDDASTDDTVDKCKEWIDTHGKRFHTCKIIESEKNTGVAPNANRGLKQCHGEWIKVLGGDDLFLPNAVEEVLRFATPDKDVIVTQYREFTIINGEKISGSLHPSKDIERFYNYDVPDQKSFLLKSFIEATIGFFIRKSVIDRIGGYNERYPMYEDVPMFFKISNSGYKFHLLKKECFQYRVSESITHVSGDKVYNLRFSDCSFRFHREIKNKQIPLWDITYHQGFWIRYIQYKIIVKLFNNKNNECTRFIQKLAYYLTIDNYVKALGHFKRKN